MQIKKHFSFGFLLGMGAKPAFPPASKKSKSRKIMLNLQDKRHIKDKVHFHINKFVFCISLGCNLILMLFCIQPLRLRKCMELGIGKWILNSSSSNSFRRDKVFSASFYQ